MKMDVRCINLQTKALFYFIILVQVAIRIHITVCSNLPQEKYDYGPNCESYLEVYANRTAEFTECFIRHARPVRVCQKCIAQYYEVLNSYDNITQSNGNGTDNCQKVLVNVDRLEVIEDSFNYVEKQWEKASCEKCFFPNRTIIEDTSKMFQLNDSLYDCVRLHTAIQNNTQICDLCAAQYMQLNDFYDIHNSYNGFCMDVVDMMNSTRVYWSVHLGCFSSREKPDVLFLIFGFTITSLPVVLYALIWLCATVSNQEMQYQQRWTSRFRTSALTIN